MSSTTVTNEGAASELQPTWRDRVRYHLVDVEKKKPNERNWWGENALAWMRRRAASSVSQGSRQWELILRHAIWLILMGRS
jgi:hypothetical protein